DRLWRPGARRGGPGEGGRGARCPRLLAAGSRLLRLLRADAGQPGRRDPAGEPGERGGARERRRDGIQERPRGDARDDRKGGLVKIFLDTANVHEIKDGVALGVVDGVTTNPSLAAMESNPFRTAVA